MREIRLYTDQTLQAGARLCLDKEATRHAVQVLRLQAGHPLTLFNGDGWNYTATLQNTAKQAEVLITGKQENPLESPLEVTLVQGVSRSERMDFTLQKAVELGVTGIVPVFTERSVLNLNGARLEKKIRHWRAVISSACEQSGRSRLPTLGEAVSLRDYLATNAPAGKACVLLPGAAGTFAGIDNPNNRFTLLIGPEGGLSEAETDAAQAAGFTGVSMGPRILRTETAGIAALSILQARFGDF
ncbi:16S rRNA (uracil(1498)-N(3))-methyltransferase [Granulosicoccaceae sp. 1_MG-2023]|nr:16S rRNA (uracil(1498)-N(3))-methyltransferase [Granulosicoccaceae sp. 1_MG-2023]